MIYIFSIGMAGAGAGATVPTYAANLTRFNPVIGGSPELARWTRIIGPSIVTLQFLSHFYSSRGKSQPLRPILVLPLTKFRVWFSRH